MIPVARGYLEYIAPHDKKCTCLVPDEAPNACAKRIKPKFVPMAHRYLIDLNVHDMLLYDEAITLLKQKHSFISKRWQLQSHAVRPLIFLHVHKAGGTQMCRIARFMGLGLPSQGTTYNCNDKNKGDSCFHSYTPKSLKTCKGRHEYMKANSISFAAIESFLGHEPCELNNYLVTARHPILRTFSHIVANPPHHMRLNPETVPAFMDLVRSAETSNKTSSLSGDLHTALYRPALFDNFLTRTLLGENAFRLPMRGITRTHFNAARRRLEKMQLVIPASNCTFEVRKMLQLVLGLPPHVSDMWGDGCTCDLLPQLSPHSMRRCESLEERMQRERDSGKYKLLFRAETAVARMSSFDIELFRYGNELFEKRFIKAFAEHL